MQSRVVLALLCLPLVQLGDEAILFHCNGECEYKGEASGSQPGLYREVASLCPLQMEQSLRILASHRVDVRVAEPGLGVES